MGRVMQSGDSTADTARARSPRGVSHVSAAAIRVALAEGDFLAREGITRVLERLDGIELVASCGDLETLRAEIERTNPDVVLTDVRMPPRHTDEGLRLAAELRSTHPRIGVIVLSEQAEPGYATALFAQGSHRRAYLLKERLHESADLARAIREVAGGGAFVEAAVVDQLLSAWRPRDPAPLSALTAREREILALIAEGYTNRAIADRVRITKRGVERHINTIFAKLDLGDPDDVSRRVKAALLYLADEGRLARYP
jgi:DNA-binding NarL/FixJ family response regulator